MAGLLADGCDLAHALDALVGGLGVSGVAVRSAAGDLLGVGGNVVRHADGPVLELPVPRREAPPAVLTVHGARPSHLPVLRTAASIIGLALTPERGVEILDAADAERDALADSLHDGPVQSLVVARLMADAAVRGGDPTAARDAVQDALVELRRTLWQLRPRGGAGLVDSLHQLSAQRVDAGLEPLDVVVRGTADLSGTAGTLAYRIVQAAAGPASRVVLRTDGPYVDVDVDGSLPHPELWAVRARSLGGDLFASSGRIRLVLPLTTSPRNAP